MVNVYNDILHLFIFSIIIYYCGTCGNNNTISILSIIMVVISVFHIQFKSASIEYTTTAQHSCHRSPQSTHTVPTHKTRQSSNHWQVLILM